MIISSTLGTVSAMQHTSTRNTSITVRRALTITGNSILCALYANGTYEFGHALYDTAMVGAHPAYIAGMLFGTGYMLFMLYRHNHATWRACERAIRRDPLASVALPLCIAKDAVDWYAQYNVLSGDQMPERCDNYASVGVLRSAAGCSRLVFLGTKLFENNP